MSSIDHDSAEFAASVWAMLGEDPSLLPWLLSDARAAHLPSPLAVGALATASVRLAAAEAVLLGLNGGRGAGRGLPELITDPDRTAVSFSSETVFRLRGRRPTIWAPLSGFWETADGWVRVHANYPHHRARLLTLPGMPEEAGPDEFQAALRRRDAREWEDLAAEQDAVLAAVRDAAEWAREPAAATLSTAALLDLTVLGAACDPPDLPSPEASLAAPLAGLRVLDLTRAIAGPVATRTLAYLGADVLRIDPPALLEPLWQHLDTGQGKRTTALDLRDRADHETFRRLLDRADILVTGYRPGSLDRFGLSVDQLGERHPGLVIGQINAWGTTGPWRERRGFDSIVQAASGIALRCSPGHGRPGTLPAQALDHSAGYLLAAGLINAIRNRRADGRGRHIDVSLAGVAHTLLSAAHPATPVAPMDTRGHVQRVTAPVGRLSFAAPAFGYAGGPRAYPSAGAQPGRDRPEWAR